MRRLVLIALCTLPSVPAFALNLKRLFWSAHTHQYAYVIVEGEDLKVFLGTRPLLNQVEVSSPTWFENQTQVQVDLGTGQRLTLSTLGGPPSLWMQDAATLNLLYTEALVDERAGLVSAKDIRQRVRIRSFLESERWIPIKVDERRFRKAFQILTHPAGEIDLDHALTCENLMFPD